MPSPLRARKLSLMASLARSNELVKIFPSKQEAAARSDAGRSQLAAHHRGADTGGRPKAEVLSGLVCAAAERPTAFLCAERLWWQCHRRLLVDALTVRGVGVVRIFDAHKSEPHQLTPF